MLYFRDLSDTMKAEIISELDKEATRGDNHARLILANIDEGNDIQVGEFFKNSKEYIII